MQESGGDGRREKARIDKAMTERVETLDMASA